MEEILKIIETHRHWHPAWVLEAIERYIETGQTDYNPWKEQQILYSINRSNEYV